MRNRHGLALLCIINNIPSSTASNVWEEEIEDAEGASFLQFRTTKKTLQLDSLIAHTTAVRVISVSVGHLMPSFLEVDLPGSTQQVHDELLRWGHDLVVHDCDFCNTFLCLKPDLDVNGMVNYVFLHDDPRDAQGTIFHSAETTMSDMQIMEFLCSVGYSRAVILGCAVICEDWHRVVFHHREPQGPVHLTKQRVRTAWPERGHHQRTTAKLIDVDLVMAISAKCQLQTAFDNNDLQELFASNHGILCTDTSILQMPEPLQADLQNIPHVPLERPQDLDHYDRLLLFTDGSSRPAMKRLDPVHADEMGSPDTWAIAVVGECFNDTEGSNLTLFGWAAFPVRYDTEGAAYTGIARIGSDMAERSALIGAGLWRLALNHAIPTIVCTDAAHVGGQAFGTIGACEIDPSFRLMRSIFQALEAALPPGDFVLHHVRAHAGELFNELVDTAAKAEAHQSFNMRRQSLHLPTWAPKLHQLWMAFGQKFGLPQWQDGVLDVKAPALPVMAQAQVDHSDGKKSTELLHFAVSMASANVQSLYRGPIGHAGKLHYLQEQMRFFKFNIMAIQEARSDMGMSQNNGILRLCSGHQGGQGGIEVWIDLQLPFAINNQQKPRCFKRSHFQVVCSDHRRMIVRCDAGSWSFWLVALHAPHSGYSLTDRREWWDYTKELLTQHYDGDPIFLLMDANAAPGERDAHVVLQQGFATSANTADMRALLEMLKLYLPATSDMHHGDNATWTNFEGSKTHCIDHIAIPQQWSSRCTHSQIVHEFDMANVHDDHNAVAIQLQWTGHDMKRKPMKQQRTLSNRQDFINDVKYSQQILQCPHQEWSTDVATHTARLTGHLHEVMMAGHSTAIAGPKKCYITEEIWNMRTNKLALKKLIKATRGRLQTTNLARCFLAWKTGKCSPQQQEEHKFDISLYCKSIRLNARYYVICSKMKKSLVWAKQTALHSKLHEVNSSTSATEVLSCLRQFIGPTNPRKCKRKSLPIVKNEEGETASLPTEALGVWISFFQRMEGGQRMSMPELHQLWVRELANFQQEEVQCLAEHIPSLTDLEVALRRIQKGKARGPDGIPGELCRHHPSAIAKLLFPTMMKMIIHGHEPLEFKGGRLTMAYKGRGPHDVCSSYRSLLVSNHFGKAIHRAIRLQHAEVYEKFLQAQQTGGRRGVPVQLPLHQARAFVRQARAKRHSSAILYLDLTEAFYRILREIPIGGIVTDEFLSYLMARLNLHSDSLHELHAILAEPPALQQAGMSEMNRRCMQAIHTSTFFWLEGQEDISRTRMGTRPGDCMADLVFGYAWACVLKKLEVYMCEHDALAFFPQREHLPLFGHFASEGDHVSFAGPTWMDDLALCMEAASPAILTRHVANIGGRLLDLCEQHGMQPNLGRGKTELMMSFQGPASRKARVQFYGPMASQQFPIVREKCTSQIQIVSRYRHLGGMLHHTGDQAVEIRQRAAVAHAAMNQHKKILFCNPQIDVRKRAELFQMLVVTKFLYGADTWVAMDDRTMQKFSSTVMKLYRRLLPELRHDEHISDQEILVKVAQPSPLELLHRARLRYFATLVHAKLPEIWALFAQDVHWCSLIEQAMIWMWEQLKAASTLPDPREHYVYWLQLIQCHPRYWKRLVRRACEHSILQRQKMTEVIQFHETVLQRVEPLCDGLPQEEPADGDAPCNVFGCLGCGLRCRSRAGEAAHMYKRHGLGSRLRRLFDEPTCPACLKCFHTNQKMKAHLYYNRACRQRLESNNMSCHVAPGAGSQEDRRREEHHDRVLPPIQGLGPLPEVGRQREIIEYYEELYDFLVEWMENQDDIHTLSAQIQLYVQNKAISWTGFCATLRFFKDSVEVTDAEAFNFDLKAFQSIMDEVMTPTTRSCLQSRCKPKKRSPQLEDLNERCRRLQHHIECHGVPHVPRTFGRHRILLHAFSGRRRVGDLQFYVDRLASLRTAYVVHVISMDIIVDPHWGDASNPQTRAYWIQAIRNKWVLAFVGGPPCETWSSARGHAVDVEDERSSPRIIRDLEQLWGFDATTLREVSQLIVGNTLLCFALWAVMELALSDGFAVLEHPAEPAQPEAASIWRLPFMQVLLAMPHVQQLRFAQGLLGAPSPKPTHLLVVNLPELLGDLHRHRVRRELPRQTAIGKSHTGAWRTTILKEYPPAFCCSMAESFLRAFDACEVDHSIAPSDEFLRRCAVMVCTEYGQAMGADYAL